MTDKTELAKRAVACKGWRWMPGMCNQHDDRILCASSDRVQDDEGLWKSAAGLLPSLDDPATLGCLEHLVREACGWNCVAAHDEDEGWVVYEVIASCHWPVRGAGNTRAEALIDALEAAP